MKEFFLGLTIKQRILMAIMLLIILLSFAFAYNYFYSKDEKKEQIQLNSIDNTEELNETEEEVFSLNHKNSKVVVHVVGEVNEPGVVTLNEGSRIIDAINAAGDKTEDADLSKINLAYIIEDGTQIYVPRIGENKEEYITEDAGDGVIIESAKIDEENNKEIRVNINNASLDKLQSLPGIGSATAQKIVDYRTENGKFKEIDDLKNVPGIGESKFNSIKDMIVVK